MLENAARNPAPEAPAAPVAADPLATSRALAALSKRDAAVLRELTLLADRNGQCAPGQLDLAKACRMSERTVREAIKSLERLGWISREIVSAGAKGRSPDRLTVHPAPRPAA